MSSDNSITGTGSSQKPVSRLFGHFLIKEHFQFKFALMVCGFMALATTSIWFFGNAAVDQLIANSTIQDPLAIEQLRNVNGLVLKISIIFMGVALFLSLMFSHLVAGPIYRFEKTLEGVRDGNLTLFVKLRKRDEFKETAELFNQALASLRRKIQKERDVVNSSVEKMAAVSVQLRQNGRSEEAAALDALLADLRNAPPQVKI